MATNGPMLEVIPANATFKGPFNQSTTSSHQMKNTSNDKRIVTKIKTNDNNLFRLRPVYSIIDPGQEQNLTIVCNKFNYDSSKPPQVRIVIQYMECSQDCNDPIEPWKTATQWKKHKMTVAFELQPEAPADLPPLPTVVETQVVQAPEPETESAAEEEPKNSTEEDAPRSNDGEDPIPDTKDLAEAAAPGLNVEEEPASETQSSTDEVAPEPTEEEEPIPETKNLAEEAAPELNKEKAAPETENSAEEAAPAPNIEVAPVPKTENSAEEAAPQLNDEKAPIPETPQAPEGAGEMEHGSSANTEEQGYQIECHM